jgi:hypothetical protein
MPHSQQEAEAILEPYMGRIEQIYPKAWERWEELGTVLPETRLQICPRSRASLLNNFGATVAEELFADMAPNVILTDQPRFLLLIFESKLHLRLKKYRNKTYQTSGIPTDQRNQFEYQQPLTGFPEATNCVHGYVLKGDASGYAETAIRCATGNQFHWKIDVPMGGEGGQVVEHRQPPTGDQPQPGISSTHDDQEQAKEGGIGG